MSVPMNVGSLVIYAITVIAFVCCAVGLGWLLADAYQNHTEPE